MHHVRQFVAKSIHSIDKQVVSRCTAPARGVAVVKEGAYPFSHSGPWIRASNFNKGFQPPSTAMHSRRTWPVVKTAGVSWRPRQAGQWTRRAWPGLGVLCPKGTWSMIQRDNTLKVRCKQQGIKQTLPKAQRTRGLSSSCQSHIASSNTYLDQISSSES